LRRWLRPPRQLRPTRAGWVFFALTLGTGFASLNTGNNLLYLMFSLLLSFLVLSGVLSESALSGIHVRRRFPRELFAERPAVVVLEVSNDRRRATSFAIAVEDLLGTDLDRSRFAGRVFALRVAPGATQERAYRLTPTERGTLSFAGFRVSTRFPFGMFSKSMRLEAPGEALVYPALDPQRARAPRIASLHPVHSRRGRSAQSPESATLREWAPGDSNRRIHWRASLRKGTLLIRQSEPEDGAAHRVALATAGARPGVAFETAVRRAASEVVAYLDAGYRVELLTDSTRLPGGRTARERMLAFLARVAPSSSAPSAASGKQVV